MNIILGSKRRHYAARVSVFLITVALILGMAGCDLPSYNPEIRDWYDLDAIRDNLGGSYILLDDLNSSTPGYTKLASPTANEGKGWQPIGPFDPARPLEGFTGIFDGQVYEIRDLFINRPDEGYVGLFGWVGEGGVIKNLGVMNATVTGEGGVGGLVGGQAYGIVNNCYTSGNVNGMLGAAVGGLAGMNGKVVSNSYSSANVNGGSMVGGLVGTNVGIMHDSYSAVGTVSNSYSTGSVTGYLLVGGLVGSNQGTVGESYSTGGVTGDENVGGLVGDNWGTVSNSYSTGSVTGNSTVGGLVAWNFNTVSDSFWNTETSGQSTSDGGTGKTTAEMQDITTFSGAMWDITAVANPDMRNPAYIWNIVDDETYPFLSWQS